MEFFEGSSPFKIIFWNRIISFLITCFEFTRNHNLDFEVSVNLEDGRNVRRF